MIVTLQDLALIRNTHKQIVLGTGTFDLFHYEHLKYLQLAKSYGNILVVAIKDDKTAALKRKGRPIIIQEQRIAIVDALKCVDYTVMTGYQADFKTELKFDNQKQQQWLSTFEKVFELLRPDILFYEENPVLQSARERVFEKFNIKGISQRREATISTTKIIEKI